MVRPGRLSPLPRSPIQESRETLRELEQGIEIMLSRRPFVEPSLASRACAELHSQDNTFAAVCSKSCKNSNIRATRTDHLKAYDKFYVKYFHSFTYLKIVERREEGGGSWTTSMPLFLDGASAILSRSISVHQRSTSASLLTFIHWHFIPPYNPKKRANSCQEK